jgi:uncharacterized lipoprotein
MIITNTKLFPAALAAVLLGGCGLFGDKEEDKPVYFEASETPYLAVPEGLNEPRRDQSLEVLGEQVPAGVAIDTSNRPPRVQITDGSQNPYSRINFGAQGSYLLVKDAPASVYSRLKQAIESSGMELLDQNDAAHSYDFYYADPPRPQQKRGFFKSMLFWRNDKPVDYSGNYRTRLEAAGEETRVYILDMEGKATSEGAADAVLGLVLETLG